MIGVGELKGGLYYFHGNQIAHANKVSTTVDVDTLHRRLGHAPFPKIQYLFPCFSSKNFTIPCDVCHQARQTCLSFLESDNISKNVFDLVHIDTWGPYGVSSITGASYFLTIVDDHSRSTWVHLMKSKSEAPSIFTQFVQMIKTQFGKHIKAVRTDNAPELIAGQFKAFLLAQGMTHQTTCPHTPQQNGVVERKHKIC